MSYQASPILAAAASPAFLAKGCVNVIELDVLKERAGERWPRVREGVYAYLETQLRIRLGPSDLYIRLGDLAYLITMPATEADDVSAICLRVAFDLYKNFLGEASLDWVHVNTVVGSDDDNLVLKRIAIEKIVALAERVGIQEDNTGPISRRLNPSLSAARAPATAPSIAANGVAMGGGIAVPIGGSSPVSTGPEMRPVDVVRRTGQQQQRAVEAPTFIPPRVEYHYVPIWQVPNAAVTSYACEPKNIVVAGRPGCIPLCQLTPQERLSVEMSAFLSAVAGFEKSADSGVRFLLVVPFSFEALASPNGRMEIQTACRGLSRQMRPYLTFMLYDVPPGVAQTRLANLVTILQPFGRGVIATIAPSRRSYVVYQGIGLTSVGFDLAAFAPQQPFSHYDAEELSQFSRRSGLGTFLWNVRSKAALKFAQDAGIQMLSGPEVMPYCTDPYGMQRLTWAQVLAKPEVELWL